MIIQLWAFFFFLAAPQLNVFKFTCILNGFIFCFASTGGLQFANLFIVEASIFVADMALLDTIVIQISWFSFLQNKITRLYPYPVKPSQDLAIWIVHLAAWASGLHIFRQCVIWIDYLHSKSGYSLAVGLKWSNSYNGSVVLKRVELIYVKQKFN